MKKIDLPSHDIWSTDNIIFFQKGLNVSYINESGEHLEKTISDKKFVLRSIRGEIIQRTKSYIKILNSSFQAMKEVELNHSQIQVKDYYSDKVLIREIGDKNGEIVIYDFNSNLKTSVTKSDHNFAQFVDHNFIILNDERFIKVVDLTAKETKWELDVADILDSEVAQIYSGKIAADTGKVVFYVYSKNWDKYSLFILDAFNGKTLYSTDDISHKFQVLGNNIYSLNSKKRSIIKLNIQILEREEIQISDELNDLQIHTDCVPFFTENEVLIALQKPKEDIYSLWARINLNDGKIISIQEELIDQTKPRLKDNQAFVSSFVRSKTHIGVKISGPSLVIYENKKVANK